MKLSRTLSLSTKRHECRRGKIKYRNPSQRIVKSYTIFYLPSLEIFWVHLMEEEDTKKRGSSEVKRVHRSITLSRMCHIVSGSSWAFCYHGNRGWVVKDNCTQDSYWDEKGVEGVFNSVSGYVLIGIVIHGISAWSRKLKYFFVRWKFYFKS